LRDCCAKQAWAGDKDDDEGIWGDRLVAWVF
jgi:hypothetical protein